MGVDGIKAAPASQVRRSQQTMKAAWVNDIHLEFLDERSITEFFDELKATDADCILVGGDIGQANTVCDHLRNMELSLQCPVYFVLGNHDFYHGSIADVRTSITRLVSSSGLLRWLSISGIVKLTAKTCLIGHDGWGDGRYGDFHGSEVVLNDFLFIQELSGLPKNALLTKLQRLGEEAGRHFQTLLPQALDMCDHIVVLTHVPPFLEAAWYDGRYCDDNWLPFFSCKAVGEVLKDTMLRYVHKRMTVLCGHTHSGGSSQISANLTSFTGPARYGHPRIQRLFEWE